MKLAWFEDFLTLTEAGTFSKAAQVRNVTQPAFSRRIQMLESWLGVELVDRRSHHHLQLTATAARYEPKIQRFVAMAYELRSHMQADSLAKARISLTMQHTLMVSHMPKLLRFLKERRRETTFNVRTGNLEECVAQLMRGEADLLLRYDAEIDPQPHDPPDMERLTLGYDRLVPVTVRDADGQPTFNLCSTDSVTLLNYPENSFLGRVIRQECLPELAKRYSIDSACESAFTLGIKEMALAGMGIAWLPYGLIERDLDTGNLVSLHEKLGSPSLAIVMCRRPNDSNPPIDSLWELLQNAQPQL